ncbi:MAG: GNAT family N-acetyltransferase [Flavisolibacter sp.]
MALQWILKRFEELSPHQLYAILQLRNEVFVVEQNCVFQDADGRDPASFHLMGMQDDQLLAYTRLLPPGLAYPEPSIGRVVTSPKVRGSGAGKELMEQSLSAAYQLFGRQPIRIGAQLYLKKFYASFGFRQVSEVYDEDGIDHIYMLKED